MGMTKQDGERGASLEDLDRPSAQRISGVFPSPSARDARSSPPPSGDGNTASAPVMPVRIAYLLRVGLTPPERVHVTSLLDTGLLDAEFLDAGLLAAGLESTHAPINAYVVDSRADPSSVQRRLEEREAAVLDGKPYVPLYVCGEFANGDLARLARTALASPYLGDLAQDRGLEFVAGVAEVDGRLQALLDPRSQLAWFDGELGPWLAELYAGHLFTRTELRTLALLGLGSTPTEIASLLGVSLSAVNHHSQSMRSKANKADSAALLARMHRALGKRVDRTEAVQHVTAKVGRRTPPDGSPV
jgi:DNA-binding CsgD family transcriptional regulator